MRLIDADALQKVFEDMANDKWNKKTSTTWGRAYEESVDIVDEQPTIEERKRGRWVDGHCSECGCDVPAYIIDWKWQKDMDAKFCPMCGADMRKGEEE